MKRVLFKNEVIVCPSKYSRVIERPSVAHVKRNVRRTDHLGTRSRIGDVTIILRL